KGNKALFKDTYAYEHWDFEQTNPVIQLDLSKVNGDQPEVISDKLLEIVFDAAELMDIELKETPYPDVALNKLILKAGKTTPVVILVDEYDTPILENLHQPKLDAIKQILRSFYKIIKANEAFIRFVFITGISKFTHVGVFSALNNLEDITLNSDYAAVVGYTEKEIRHTFGEQIEQVKTKTGLTDADFWEKLAHYYNGYSWDGEQFVYNPLSILKFLGSGGEFIPYWMETGSPEFIAKYSQDKQFNISDFEQLKVPKYFLNKQEMDTASPESFLTQAGYLSIKDQDADSYTLDFPNNEVRQSFCELILNIQYRVHDTDILNVKVGLRKALAAQDVDKIVEQFKIIYSSIPYVHFDSNKTEHFYSAMLLMYLQASGFDASPERLNNKGRLDLALQYKHQYQGKQQQQVYIFELKTAAPQKAIEQIIEKNYAGAWGNHQVTLVGLQIDFAERNIVNHQSIS
ncbi:MAG: ATP-binding protein, partial [Psychrosphaera sp.]|nr:ATP-binding protein [Psychrosphaera sp.]